MTQGSYQTIGVIGAGAWGTALASVAAQTGRRVILWAREPEVVEDINRRHRNMRFLPDIDLPKGIQATCAIDEAARTDALLLVSPAQHVRSSLGLLGPHLIAGTPVMLCAKGIEQGTGKMLTEILGEVLPQAEPAILSGPSFAHDVAKGLPTAVTIAARGDIAGRLQSALGHGTFRPYASDDLTGVALGGAAKNVYAIACGVVEGMGLGESARAALLARAFAELTRLGEAMGAKPETLMGLSGLGDLVLTATSATSRNFAFGLQLGKGASLKTLSAPGKPLAEGALTAPALAARAARHNVELPIAETVAYVLDGKLPLQSALIQLMNRPLKPE